MIARSVSSGVRPRPVLRTALARASIFSLLWLRTAIRVAFSRTVVKTGLFFRSSASGLERRSSSCLTRPVISSNPRIPTFRYRFLDQIGKQLRKRPTGNGHSRQCGLYKGMSCVARTPSWARVILWFVYHLVTTLDARACQKQMVSRLALQLNCSTALFAFLMASSPAPLRHRTYSLVALTKRSTSSRQMSTSLSERKP